jgi:4-amino-4-deoxy-L-arabinose transferase-like glycosyltransferase
MMGSWNGSTLGKLKRITFQPWIDPLWMVALGSAALLLLTVNLGGVPLRDWDEGTVAQVAREIWRSSTDPVSSPTGSLTWLYPTLEGQPYLNKPTLLHILIAQCFAIGGVNEWMARLPGALLTALSVPLLYGIGREIFVKRTPAVFAALVYLTWLPVVRHGRLAMLDGALVCFFLFSLWCLLRARRDLRWGLGVGIGFGLMALTKGPIALLLIGLGFGFIAWDTPRLLTSRYLWSGMGLGSAPAIAWYGAQWVRYGPSFWGINLVDQSFSRLWKPVEGNQGAVWYYLWEILKYTLPWLIFLPQGFWLAWKNRELGWAKLVLLWSAVYLLVISLMQTKLPWYIMPLYPALALVTGAMLATIWNPKDIIGTRPITQRKFSQSWIMALGGLATVGWILCLIFSPIGPFPQPILDIIVTAIALTLTVTTILVIRQDSQFILVLMWGCYVSLLLLMVSPYWLWELQESYPVKPVAILIQQNTPPGTVVLTSYPDGRPSLNFYSDRRVIPIAEKQIPARWSQPPYPYLLTDQATLKRLALPSVQVLGMAEGWLLVERAQNLKVAQQSANRPG